MNREEAMNAVALARSDAAVVLGPGANNGLLYERADSPATIYNMDMGYAAAVGLGIALACPGRRVLVIEGDGSFFAGSTVLSTIWRLRPPNLSVLVIDNEVWGTGDGLEPTATAFGLDFAGLALSVGWRKENVRSLASSDELAQRLSSALSSQGPHLLFAKTEAKRDKYLGSYSARPRPGRPLLDCAVFMRAELSRNV